MLRRVRPDVLVAALTADEQEAVELNRRLRGFKPEDGGMIPAIVVVPSAQFGEERMRAWGFERYLTKPVDPWRLCRLVSSLTMPR